MQHLVSFLLLCNIQIPVKAGQTWAGAPLGYQFPASPAYVVSAPPPVREIMSYQLAPSPPPVQVVNRVIYRERPVSPSGRPLDNIEPQQLGPDWQAKVFDFLAKNPYRQAQARLMSSPQTSPPTSSPQQERPLRILAYGDSLTAGFGLKPYYPWAPVLANLLTQKLQRPVVAHAHGNPGWTSMQLANPSELRKAVTESMNAHGGRPDLVLVMAGTNDKGEMTPRDSVRALGRIHRFFHSAGATTVALAVPEAFCHTSVTGEFKQWRDDLNTAIARNLVKVVGTSRRQSRRSFLAGSEAAASGNKISLIDVSENGFRFGATNAWGFPLFLPDGLHFTKEGDDEFARLLADRLVGEGLVQ